MSHGHEHSDIEAMGDRRLLVAISINMLLTLVQIIGGILSSSLSLIADALHNFSDASSLLIAWVARKIGRKPADSLKTFGYKRAEVIAALINLVILLVVGIYLIAEALWRIYLPQQIEGWMVVWVASIALAVDAGTALLTYSMSKNSVNMRAAFLHNLSDALASVGVIVAGSLILLYGWYWTDTLITLAIAGYVLYQAMGSLPSTLHILMQGTPQNISIETITHAMEKVEGVNDVHHIHIWQLDEHQNALEAHVVIDDLSNTEAIKSAIKRELGKYAIGHSSLEFESTHCKENEINV